jgi:hypothetical protein
MAPEHDEDKKLRELKAVLRSLQRLGDDPPPAAGNNLHPTGTALESLVDRRDTSEPPSGRAKEPASFRAGNGLADRNFVADKRPVQGRRLGAFALALIAAGTVMVLASDLFFKYWSASPTRKQAAAVNIGASSSAPKPGPAEAKISVPGLPIETRQPAKQLSAVDGEAALPVDTAPTLPVSPIIGEARQLMDGGHIATARELLLQPTLAASQESAWLLARSYDPNYLATVQSPDATADKRQAEEWYRRWRDIGARNGMVMDDLRLNRIIDAMR